MGKRHSINPAISSSWAVVLILGVFPPPGSSSDPSGTATSTGLGLPGLAGKNVLITGGTSGIGQAVAVRFAQNGANIAINYLRDPDEAADTESQVHACVARVRRMGVQELLVGGDVTSEEAVTAMVEEAAAGLGGVDILVNNAGIQISSPSDELSAADFDRVLAVNLRGAFLCARQFIRHLLARGGGGAIVNVSSVHQLIPRPDYLSYSVSKGGMQNLTRTLALEYAERGIRVNSIGPGATVTPINRAWIDDPVKRGQVESHIPMRRAGTADEMGAVACFLASDDAAYITGQTIFVDGGLTLFPSFREPWSSE
jgi:glucose 1-dehydrogenase